jgi:hypothetical protein
MDSLIIILMMLGIAWFIMDSARAREMALAIASETCKHRGYQLLEESVQLKSIRLRKSPEGLRIYRLFQFEFSDNSVSRRYGSVGIIGRTIDHVILSQESAEDFQ